MRTAVATFFATALFITASYPVRASGGYSLSAVAAHEVASLVPDVPNPNPPPPITFIKGYHTYQSTTLPYHIFIPPNLDPQRRYPIVLCLHGSGERGDDSSAVSKNSMALVWARDSNQTRWPCFVFVPQCPTNRWWTELPIELTVIDILDSLLIEFPIDTNRIYVTGLSMGGYSTWDLIVRFPARFAAAVPMSGGGDASKAALIRHIPIWNFHGAVDNVVPVANSRAMITALEQAGDTAVYTDCHNTDCTGLPDNVIADKIRNGATLLYTEYQYGGHSIWDQAYNYHLLLPWVFSQSITVSDVGGKTPGSLPVEFSLQQNYPNPFNPITGIRYQVQGSSDVRLVVYDLLGREVAVLMDEKNLAGSYNVLFDASGLASGVYFYRLQARDFSQTRKMLLMK